MTLALPANLRAEMVEHCLGAAPNEGCGLFAVDEREVSKIYTTSNAEASPSAYTIPPGEHFAAISDAESRGWEIGGVFHSHPNGPARPSATDVKSALDPWWVYVVIGLTDAPEVRAWRIEEGQMTEVVLT